MSLVEDTIARIAGMGGVQGYLIVDGSGTVLRQSKEFTTETAALYSSEVLKLSARARHMVRDLDPKNDLDFFRLRMKNGTEVIAAPGDNCLVIILQAWNVPQEVVPAADAK